MVNNFEAQRNAETGRNSALEQKGLELERALPEYQVVLKTDNTRNLFAFMAEAFGTQPFADKRVGKEKCKQWLAQFGTIGDNVALRLINENNPKAALQEILASGEYKKLIEEGPLKGADATTTDAETAATTEEEPAAPPAETPAETEAATTTSETPDETEEETAAAPEEEKEAETTEPMAERKFSGAGKENANWGLKKRAYDMAASIIAAKGFEHVGAGITLKVANALSNKWDRARSVAEWLETNTDMGKKSVSKKTTEAAETFGKESAANVLILKHNIDATKTMQADERKKEARAGIGEDALKARYDAFKASIADLPAGERAVQMESYRKERRAELMETYKNAGVEALNYDRNTFVAAHQRFSAMRENIENNQHLAPAQRGEALGKLAAIMTDAKAYNELKDYDAAKKIENVVEDYVKYSEQKAKIAKETMRTGLMAAGLYPLSSLTMMLATPIQKYLSLDKTKREEQGLGGNLKDLFSEKYKKPFVDGFKSMFGSGKTAKERGIGTLMAFGSGAEVLAIYGGMANIEKAFDASTYAHMDPSAFNGITKPIETWAKLFSGPIDWVKNFTEKIADGQNHAYGGAASQIDYQAVATEAKSSIEKAGASVGELHEKISAAFVEGQSLGRGGANAHVPLEQAGTKSTAQSSSSQAKPTSVTTETLPAAKNTTDVKPTTRPSETPVQPKGGAAEKPVTEKAKEEAPAVIKPTTRPSAENEVPKKGVETPKDLAAKMAEAQVVQSKDGVSQVLLRQMKLQHPEKSEADLTRELIKKLSSEDTKVLVNGKPLAEVSHGLKSVIDAEGHNELRLSEPGTKVILHDDGSVEIQGKTYKEDLDALAARAKPEASKNNVDEMKALGIKGRGIETTYGNNGNAASTAVMPTPFYDGVTGDKAVGKIVQLVDYRFAEYDSMAPTAENAVLFEKQMDQLGDIYAYVAAQGAADPKGEKLLTKALVYDLLPRINHRVEEAARDIADANRGINAELAGKGSFSWLKNMFRSGPDLNEILKQKVQNDLAAADFQERLVENPRLQGLKIKNDDLLTVARREFAATESSAKETQAALEKYVTEKSPSMAATDKAILARRIDELAADAAKRGAPTHTMDELKAIKAKLAIGESKTDNGQRITDSVEKKAQPAEAIPEKKETQSAPVEKPAEIPLEKAQETVTDKKAENTVVSETPVTESFALKNGERSIDVTFNKNPKSGAIEMELKGNSFHGSRLLDPESENEATSITPYLNGPVTPNVDEAMDRIRAYQEILNDKNISAHLDYVNAVKKQLDLNVGMLNNALHDKKAVVKREDGKWSVVLE